MVVNIQCNLIIGLVMRNGVGVTDVNGTVRQDGAEESTDDSLGLVGAPDEAITDVEYNERMNFRR
jgi:hypothetical protein